MINISMLAALFLGARVPGATAGTGNDYQLRDIDGQLHRPSDYRGRWLIINFRATWCPPCIAEMPEL